VWTPPDPDLRTFDRSPVGRHHQGGRPTVAALTAQRGAAFGPARRFGPAVPPTGVALVVVSDASTKLGLRAGKSQGTLTGSVAEKGVVVAEGPALVIRSIPAVFRPPESEERRSSPIGTVLFGFVVLQALVAVALALFWPLQYRQLTREDDVVEYLSAFWWALAAVVAFAAIASPAVRRRRSVPVYLLAGAFFVICGGEEISWGQRILGFAGPDALIEINKQEETNLHNIGSISVYANAFYLLAFVVFVIWPALLRANPKVARFAQRRRLPVVTRHASLIYLAWFCVWLIVGVRYGTLGSHPFSLWGYYTQLDDEIFEYGTAVAYTCLVILDVSEVRRSRQPDEALPHRVKEP
jgi:hypothetical protein